MDSHKCLDICCATAFISFDRQCFAVSKVAVDEDEPVVTQRICVWPTAANTTGCVKSSRPTLVRYNFNKGGPVFINWDGLTPHRSTHN